MTYQKAIEKAKRVAKIAGENIIIIRHKKHWWNRYSYDYTIQGMIALIDTPYLSTALLIITPNGTISQ